MAEFALVGPGDIIDRYSVSVDPVVQTKVGWKWLPVEVTNPASNDGQIKTGPVITVLADKVTRVWTVRNKTAQELIDELNASRDAIVTEVDQVEDVLRAFALTLIDELNAHSTKMTAILNAIDGAGTFAQMKTAIATVTDPPQRTIAQLRASIRSKFGM